MQNRKSILILVDNLRIGGIQRLVLDECYSLEEFKIDHQIVSLSPVNLDDSMMTVDSGYSKSKTIKIDYLVGNKIQQIKTLTKYLSKNYDLVVTHSTTGAALIWFARAIMFKQIKIHLYIHQLISLSSKMQANKRLFYSIFANSIFVSSDQFRMELEDYINRTYWRVIIKKKITFDRMGVFIPRLKDTEKNVMCSGNSPHLIFASRLTAWKGYKNYLKICEMYPKVFHQAIITSYNFKSNEIQSSEKLSDNIHLYLGKGPACFEYTDNSIHIYPTAYGGSVKFPQSIGMNVLEFIALGVPSIISDEGFESWPEIKGNPIVQVCNWDNETEVQKIIQSILNMSQEDKIKSSVMLHEIISIDNHVKNLMRSL